MQKYELTRGHFVSLGRNMPREMVGNHKLHPLNKYHMDDGKNIGRNLTKTELQAGRLPDGWHYSQPSEEQWEYAARAGTKTPYFFGADMSQLPRFANFGDKSYYDTGDIFSNSAHRVLDDGSPGPSLVGAYLPNPWGLHDIYGNVSEWCENGSAYRDSYASRSDQDYLGYRLVIQKAPPSAPKK
ncbi:MAG: SUMF1/EgtB/PvdO family nonheme iron enzyme [Verrucomicrobiota bacterium]